MSVVAHSLVSLDALIARLGLGVPTGAQESQLEDALNAAADRLESEFLAGRRPLSTAYTNVRFDGSGGLHLWDVEWPITALGVVTVGEVVQTVWTQESDGDPATFNVRLAGNGHPQDPGYRRVLIRAAGWPAGLQNIKLASYTAGYGGVGVGDPPMPAALLTAATWLAAHEWMELTRGRFAGEASLSLDGQSVTYNAGLFLARVGAMTAPYRRWGF